MGLKYEVQLLGNNKLGLFVADGFILKIAQEEFYQNTIKNTNTSGLEWLFLYIKFWFKGNK